MPRLQNLNYNFSSKLLKHTYMQMHKLQDKSSLAKVTPIDTDLLAPKISDRYSTQILFSFYLGDAVFSLLSNFFFLISVKDFCCCILHIIFFMATALANYSKISNYVFISPKQVITQAILNLITESALLCVHLRKTQ